MTPEAKVKTKLRRILNGRQPHVVFQSVTTSGYGNSGAGDYILCVCGVYLELEVKAGSNKQTELQLLRETRIVEAGGIYMVVNEHNLDEVARVIDGFIAQESRLKAKLNQAIL